MIETLPTDVANRQAPVGESQEDGRDEEGGGDEGDDDEGTDQSKEVVEDYSERLSQGRVDDLDVSRETVDDPAGLKARKATENSASVIEQRSRKPTNSPGLCRTKEKV